MLYGISPFARTNYDPFDFWGETEKNFTGRTMQTNTCKTDIRDDGDKYVMESEMPGFEKEDIKLDINGSYLTISAEHSTKNDEKDSKGNYIRRERSYGSFRRSFDITDVDENNISAEYKNGILTIDLPKRKPEQPVSKRLEIK